jgi:CheY-like chemotaxis protein
MKTILIVDDEPDIRKTLAGVLGPAYKLLEAGDGAEALKIAGVQAPDLVFLDVSMPDMDGVEVLEVLKRARPALPVIMLTGEQDIGIAKRSLDFGATMYITKPYEARYVREQVKRLLSGEVQPADDKPWRIV